MVKMIHDDPEATGGPTTALVPEDGIAMMRSVGWYLENEKEEHTTKRKRAESEKEM
jgi:hypothetical protein